MISRSVMKGLLVVAVTATAATTTGFAMADESLPSVQVELCADNQWTAYVTGKNQRGELVDREAFFGEGCTVLTKNGTAFWWAIEQADMTVATQGSRRSVQFNDLAAAHDGRTVRREFNQLPVIECRNCAATGG